MVQQQNLQLRKIRDKLAKKKLEAKFVMQKSKR